MAPRSVSPGVRAVAGPAALGIGLINSGTLTLIAVGLDQLQARRPAKARTTGASA